MLRDGIKFLSLSFKSKVLWKPFQQTNLCQQQRPNFYQQANFKPQRPLSHKSAPYIEETDNDESFKEEQFADENILSLCCDLENLDI